MHTPITHQTLVRNPPTMDIGVAVCYAQTGLKSIAFQPSWFDVAWWKFSGGDRAVISRPGLIQESSSNSRRLNASINVSYKVQSSILNRCNYLVSYRIKKNEEQWSSSLIANVIAYVNHILRSRTRYSCNLFCNACKMMQHPWKQSSGRLEAVQEITPRTYVQNS